MLMLIKGGSSFLLYEERRGGFLIKSFYLGFFLFPFCFLTLFYVISPGGEIRGFISWDEFGFLLFGQGMKLWRVWNDWITHSFLFFSCFYSYYYFFFFLTYVGEGGILWFACPFHFMKFVHRVIWRNTQRCHMGNGRRLTWCLKLKMIGEIKFDF